MRDPTLSRREFIRVAGSTASGLVVSFYWPADAATRRVSRSNRAAISLNAFVRIGEDDSVVVVLPKTELGQGAFTGCAQLIAEELEVNWRSVTVQSAPVSEVYNGPDIPIQTTGGSESISTGFNQLREAGARARVLLIRAAAREFGVSELTLVAERGHVVHARSRRSICYGALVHRAALLKPPTAVKLKDRSHWKLIGHSVLRVDGPAKVDGSAVFGCDVRLPGLHFAIVARPPAFGSQLKAVDDTESLRVPGVVSVVRLKDRVAIIATSTAAAMRGRDALRLDWVANSESLSSTRLAAEYASLVQSSGIIAYSKGAMPAGPSGGDTVIAAEYTVPYLAHAMMEPPNCAVSLTADGCDVYTGTQSQTVDRDAAAEVAGLPPDRVRIHTTYAGGGFGRRSPPDAHIVREAVEIAKAFGRAPVMTVWTREDELRGGYYRPMAHQRIEATVSPAGLPLTWRHTIVVQPITRGTIAEPYLIDPKTGLEFLTHQGASDIPYAIDRIQVSVHQPSVPIPVLWMRSVAHSYTAFAVETFIDECAHSVGRDPLEYRRALLGHEPRFLEVLRLASTNAGWGKPPPAGVARGIAIHKMYDTILAQIVEVSIRNGAPHVHRVTVAVDCGLVVNPGLARQVIEGAVLFALSAALHDEISIENGRALQGNFDDYPLVRIGESPAVDVHFVQSEAPPSGLGELGVPCLAPAIANALFGLIGTRIRRLPLKHAFASL